MNKFKSLNTIKSVIIKNRNFEFKRVIEVKGERKMKDEKNHRIGFYACQ